MCDVLWNVPFIIPIATDMAKKVLLGRRYDKTPFSYSRLVEMTV